MPKHKQARQVKPKLPEVDFFSGGDPHPRKPDFSQPEFFTAEIQLKAEDINVEKRQITVSVTSETMASRWFGYLLLGHNKDEVKLDRAKTVGSFLFAHGRDPQYGVVPPGPLVNIWLDEAARKVYATLQFDEDEKADLLFKKVQSGSLRGISAGVRFKKIIEIGPDEERSGYKGPFYMAIEWEISEVSLEPTPELIVGVGLSQESVSGTPSRSEFNQKKEVNTTMKFKVMRNGVEVEVEASELTAEERVQFGLDQAPGTQAPAPAVPNGTQTTQTESTELSADEENARVMAILGMCQQFSIDATEMNTYIKDKLSVDQVQKKILDKLAAERAPVASAHIIKDENEKFAAAAIDGLSMRIGVPVEKPAPGAESFRGVRLMALAQECAERTTGRSFRRASDEEVLRAAFGFGEHGQFMGASDFPNLLSNVANKSMLTAYDIADTTYQHWTRKGNLSDFKVANRLTLSAADTLLPMNEHGEFVASKITEAGRTVQLGTFGRKWSLSRKAIINDDLDALSTLPTRYTVSARRLINQTVYNLLTSNPKIDSKDLFSADHNNLATAGAVPTVASLSAARAAMRKQKDISGKQTLAIRPSFMLVPEELSALAEQLVASTVDPTKNNQTPNLDFVRRLSVISDPELDENSTAAWYLAAAPGTADTVEVAFLNGRDMPTIESQLSFDVLGIQWRIYIDFGVALLDWRALYKNPGASS